MVLHLETDTVTDEHAATCSTSYAYEVGDMVWGKVKSYPFWPGHIYSEALASYSVRRSKREGHLLVAFFGDNSYGWFEPAELIPFEENFDEKSRQTSSQEFVSAVEEAVVELSRRRSLGLVCRCRNQYNFWPYGVESYLVVDMGDSEPGLYTRNQITMGRNNFQPSKMLCFLQQLALTPMNGLHETIEFMKIKATVLACRKALYEEFDETYAQAFRVEPVRPPRPTVPVALRPPKAPLSGRLVIAEALCKGKASAEPTTIKEQLGKEKRKKPKAHKRPVKELSYEDAGLVEKKKKTKKEIRYKISADLAQPPFMGSNSAKMEHMPGTPPEFPLADNNMPVYPKDVVEKSISSSLEAQLAVKSGKIELPVLVRDLCVLAVDPFYKEHRDCAAIAKHVFSKYRSLVYKKSLILFSPAENEAYEVGKLPATCATVDIISEKSRVKPVTLLSRPGNPTKSWRKRVPLDRVEETKKKACDKEVNDKKQGLNPEEEVKKKRMKEPENIKLKKKSIDLEDTEKKQREAGKRVEQTSRLPNPTKLVMRFPINATLPSCAELGAKFVRFGPLDYSATRVFWKSYKCQLVYNYKAGAEAALKFCNSSNELFKCSNVKCHIRELAADAAESEPARVPEEEASVGPSQPALRIGGQSQQPQVQLKSCLKRPAGDESGKGKGRGKSRMKFAFCGEESSSRRVPVSGGFPVSSSTTAAAIENSPSFRPPRLSIPSTDPVQFQCFPVNMPFDQQHRVFNPPPFPPPQNPNDISEQMINLLMKCSHVVNNVRGFPGYMPYHPL